MDRHENLKETYGYTRIRLFPVSLIMGRPNHGVNDEPNPKPGKSSKKLNQEKHSIYALLRQNIKISKIKVIGQYILCMRL